MKRIEITQNESAQAEAYWETLSQIASPAVGQEYHELAENPILEIDVLSQLNANLQTLVELQNRTAFVLREVKYLMKI